MFARIQSRKALKTMKTTKKTDIILKTLELGAQKGLASVSMRDIASAIGIQTSTLYSHFKSKEDLMQSILDYCHDLLSKKTFIVDFKAKDAEELLTSLVDSFIETFGEVPLSQYYAVVQQQKLFSQAYNKVAHEISSMITARAQVALEYCVQRSWLDISNTDAASDFFSVAIQECLSKLVSSDATGIPIDTDWELSHLVDNLLSLFQ